MDFKMEGCWIENHPEYNRGFGAGQQSKQAEIDSVKKTKVVHGGDFRDRWEGVHITEDQFNYCYETSDSEHITEQLLFNEFECNGFGFDSNIHKEI